MSGLDAQLLSEVAGLSDSPVQCMHLGLGGWGLSEVRHLQKTFCFDFRQYLERLTSALGCQTVVKHLFKSFSFEENGYF